MSSPLRVPAFRVMWTAGLVSDTGDWLLFIAMPLVVYRITGSALGTSAAFLMELLPVVLLSPLAARLIPRVPPRPLLVAVGLAQAASLVPLLLVHDRAQLPIAFGVIAVQAGLAALFEPAKSALLPELVPAASLVPANGLVNLAQNLSRLVGGPLGGVLLAVGGLPLIVAIDVASYLASALLILRLPPLAPPGAGTVAEAKDRGTAAKDRGTDASARPARRKPSGVSSALRDPALRPTLALVLVSSIAQGLFLVLFVLFVVQRLHGSDADVGLLRGIQAVGALAAAAVLGFATRRVSPVRLAVLSAVAFGAVSLLTWNLPWATTALPAYVVLFAIVGAPGVTLTTGLQSGIQLGTTPASRGAAFAAVGLLQAVGQGAGILIGGLAVGPGSLTLLLEVQGVLYLVSAGLGALGIRALGIRVQGLGASGDRVPDARTPDVRAPGVRAPGGRQRGAAPGRTSPRS